MSLYCTEYIPTNMTEMQNEHERLHAFSSCNSTYRSQNNYKQLQRGLKKKHLRNFLQVCSERIKINKYYTKVPKIQSDPPGFFFGYILEPCWF